MILTRDQFADHFNSLDTRLGDDNSPLWIPEESIDSSQDKPQWFACVKPIGVSRFKWEYFNWCNKTLNGKVYCYSSDSDNQQEWWGFTSKDDIVLWMLKWM